MKRRKQLGRLDEDQAVCVCVCWGATFRGAAKVLSGSEVSASKVGLASPLSSFLPSSEI